MKLNSIEELIEDIRAGKMVILMDDEDRENEGDLIMAAEACQAEHINFMARYGRGLICMPMSLERCERLKLPLMVQRNGSGFGTKFTVSIEAAVGVSTGISAADRARTVQAGGACRAYRGVLRSGPHGRVWRVGGDLRDHERRRQHVASPGAGRVCQAA
jgi:3,4-dihydroxy 2-butanone 4-phosphate synthase/GTP cyclohydrolase II